MVAEKCTTHAFKLPLIGRCGDRRIVRGWSLVSAEDFAFEINDRPWQLSSRGYAIRSEAGTIGRGAEILHRTVYERHNGPIPDGMEIDHIDRNRLNNVPTNLRAVTHSQNRANSKIRSDNTSGFVGVKWYPKNRKWGACICVKGKEFFLGLFANIREAADAVNHAYAKHFPHVKPPN